MKDKVWALLVHLSGSFSARGYEKWKSLPLSDYFDETLWREVIDSAVDAGMNTIVLESIDGVKYDSHPEISRPDAYSKEWVKEQVKLCREKGIALIPKINFSAPHDDWLGEYARMLSTSVYYKVVKDLIEETYEMFDHPAYIHLGMDEESIQYLAKRKFVVYRKGELYFHDLKYLCDCVNALGAKPWIWSSPMYDMPELFCKHISPDEVIINPYYYNAFDPAHYTPVESRAEYIAYYNEDKYKEMGIKFVEEDPYLVNFRLKSLPMMEYGYKYVPCASVFNRCDYNTADIMAYYKKYASDDQILGYITAPWISLTRNERSLTYLEETFRFFKEAKETYYGK